jgi:sn-glycerol 3-phosphate transport system ATP-binding protein
MAEILLRDVRKAYAKTQVVHGVDLEIKDGEFIVILGPSGCGKSTLLRMIAGLEDISSGEISIGGKIVNDLEPLERDCAMVFQNYALYPHMSVAGNIGYALKVAGMPRREREAKIAAVARSVGLQDFLDRKPGALSGGQRQRVAMARAIIREPKVFLFDEPLSNLDAKLRVQMRHEIRRIHSRIGATSVFVTHDQHEGMTLADRMVIMNKGTVDQIGTPEEIYDRPASVYVAGFIGSPAMNFMQGTVDAATSSVKLGGGARVDIATRRAQELDGQQVHLGVRPESIVLLPPQTSPITATFEFAEELGSGRLYHFGYGDNQLTVLSSQKAQYIEGQEVGLGIKADHVHLFSSETELRLTSGEEAPTGLMSAPEMPDRETRYLEAEGST